METAVSYLSILLNDIEQTKNSLSAYNNTILVLKANYLDRQTNNEPNENEWKTLSRKITDEEKVQLSSTIGYFRAYATRAYIGYKSIAPKIKSVLAEKRKESIERTYLAIKTQVMPNYDLAEEFVQSLNDLVVDEINVQALINTTQKVNELSRASASPNLL